MILRARHLIADNHQHIENGAVRIEEGCIVEVGSADQLKGPSTTDLGDCVLLPGFINAHTHLELSHLAGRVDASVGFFDWVGELVQQMNPAKSDQRQTANAVAIGLEELLSSGVTCVGDITRQPGQVRPILHASPVRAVSFGEVIAIGSLRNRLDERLLAACDRTFESERLKVGISPHAPYTLESKGLQACAKRAESDGLRLCLHLAETLEENAFTQQHAGPLRAHLERCRLWDDAIACPGMNAIGYAGEAGLLTSSMLLAHVNYATDDEMDQLAATGVHVAYCPRTHAAFSHGPHRFTEMIERGINVCVGTDSLASNPSLSVLDELRFLYGLRPDVPPSILLDMGTIHGAKALGIESSIGSISPGKWADLVVVPLDQQANDDPWRNVLGSDASPIATMIGGQWVWGRSQ